MGSAIPGECGTDPKTRQIWVGNNGQDLWETAHLIRRGDNYGWSVTEGNHPFYLERKRGPTPIVAPTIEHSHAEFRSLTGGRGLQRRQASLNWSALISTEIIRAAASGDEARRRTRDLAPRTGGHVAANLRVPG